MAAWWLAPARPGPRPRGLGRSPAAAAGGRQRRGQAPGLRRRFRRAPRQDHPHPGLAGNGGQVPDGVRRRVEARVHEVVLRDRALRRLHLRGEGACLCVLNVGIFQACWRAVGYWGITVREWVDQLYKRIGDD